MIECTGVNFESVRIFLYHVFYGRVADAALDEARYNEKKKYILPMKPDQENPIDEESNNTYIQYFIKRDEKITHDVVDGSSNSTLKLAQILIRFVGEEAEQWAKSMHHLTKRKDFAFNVEQDLLGRELPKIGDIVPTNINFFGTMTSIAFDVILHIQYVEFCNMEWEPLEKVTLAKGLVM